MKLTTRQRNRQKKRVDEIITRLQKGDTQHSIVRDGYPESTVRYHYKKLYRPKAYQKIIERAKTYQKKRYSGLK